MPFMGAKRNLPFKSSALVSVGAELEVQIIDPETYDLASRAKELMRKMKQGPYQELIKPEITQSMMEINSSIHVSIQDLYDELNNIRNYLVQEARNIEVFMAGGGTHPFQLWPNRKIFPTTRFKNKAKLYRYLSKRSTVFGQHIHIGCLSGDDALYLTHALARYVPHFVALAASSPFSQAVDTGYHSSRLNVFNAFPLSGVIPYLLTWQEFSDFYYKLKSLKIIESMKDVYWDVRPKPEFGTVEIRVCDTPLTIKRAVELAAYVQALSHYLLTNKPNIICHDLYYIYGYNRFQASRFGFEGDIIDPATLRHKLLADDILDTIKLIEPSANYLKNMVYITSLIEEVIDRKDDATILREYYKKLGTLPKVVHEQCRLWATE